MRYRYDGRGSHVIKSAELPSGSVHTVQVFPTLRLEGAAFNGATGDYERTSETEVVSLPGLGRVVYRPGLPRIGGSDQHVLLAIPNPQGSIGTLIERNTGELVQRTTFLPYGGNDSDYRPARWGGLNSDRRFNGKEEDSEVALTYFGARYYQPEIGRWLSADPLTIHSLGADLNPYSYVSGAVSTGRDFTGLLGCPGSLGFEICAGEGEFDPGGFEVGVGAPSSPSSDRGSRGASTSSRQSAKRFVPPAPPTPPSNGGTFNPWAAADKNFEDSLRGVKDALLDGVHSIYKGLMSDGGGPVTRLLDSAGVFDYAFESLKTPLSERNGRYTQGMVMGSVGMLFIPGVGEEEAEAGAAGWVEEMGSGRAYSVLFEANIPRSPIGTLTAEQFRLAHNASANEVLFKAMQEDAELSAAIRSAYPDIETYLVNRAGNFRNAPPPNLTWHHEAEEGVMQLVSRTQHGGGGIMKAMFHGLGNGLGFSKWGFVY